MTRPTLEDAIALYEAFVERLAPNALARRVKLADLEDNLDVRRLPAVTDEDRQRMNRYVTAQKRLLAEGN